MYRIYQYQNSELHIFLLAVYVYYLVPEGKTCERREVLCPLDSHEEETCTDFVIALGAEACLLLLGLECRQVVLLYAFGFRRRLAVPKQRRTKSMIEVHFVKKVLALKK